MTASKDHQEQKNAITHSSTSGQQSPASHQKTHQTSPRIKVSPELAKALRVCIRSYGVGFVFATVPKLLKTTIAFLISPIKSTPKGQNPLVAFLSSILTLLKNGVSSKRDGMSMLLLITFGGFKLLDLFINRGMKKVILAQQLQRQTEQNRDVTSPSSSSKADQQTRWTRNDTDKIELAPELRQRITIMSSFLSSVAAIAFMHKYRKRHATIDYSLFAVVRALDVFGHVAVKKQWGPNWLRSYGALTVFVLSCTEIMFSWLYEPERLPGPYAFWITKMGRMDKRLLGALRAVRLNLLTYQQQNTPEMRNLILSLCNDLKLDPVLGDVNIQSKIPCLIVHQNVAHSCEVHAGYRWIQGFLVSSGIYIPVHLLPAAINPKAFLKKLKENPVGTITSTLLSAARSSAFLASYIALIWYGICFWRSRLMPFAAYLRGRPIPGNFIDNIYGSLLGSFLCGFSVQIEKPHRRAEMALYVLPRAMYAMWSRIMGGRLSSRAESSGEILMYAASMSVLLTGMMWNRDMVRPSMQGLLGWILDAPSIKKHRKNGNGKAKAESDSLPIEAVDDKDALATIERQRAH